MQQVRRRVRAGRGRRDRPSDAGADVRAFRYVFVSAEAHDGMFADADAGLEEADKFCANQAIKNPALAGTKWRAWMGTTAVNPRDRIANAGVVPRQYRLLNDRDVVFNQGLQYPAVGVVEPESFILLDQLGADAGKREVWTGADNAGRTYGAAVQCADWTSTGGEGMTGFTYYDGTKRQWQSGGDGVDRACASKHHVYCFEIDP